MTSKQAGVSLVGIKYGGDLLAELSRPSCGMATVIASNDVWLYASECVDRIGGRPTGGVNIAAHGTKIIRRRLGPGWTPDQFKRAVSRCYHGAQ